MLRRLTPLEAVNRPRKNCRQEPIAESKLHHAANRHLPCYTEFQFRVRHFQTRERRPPQYVWDRKSVRARIPSEINWRAWYGESAGSACFERRLGSAIVGADSSCDCLARASGRVPRYFHPPGSGPPGILRSANIPVYLTTSIVIAWLRSTSELMPPCLNTVFCARRRTMSPIRICDFAVPQSRSRTRPGSVLEVMSVPESQSPKVPSQALALS